MKIDHSVHVHDCCAQISFIDDCDDIDELMGEDWTPHEGAWHSIWTLAESCANHIRSRRPPTTEVSLFNWVIPLYSFTLTLQQVWTKLDQILTAMRTKF